MPTASPRPKASAPGHISQRHILVIALLSCVLLGCGTKASAFDNTEPNPGQQVGEPGSALLERAYHIIDKSRVDDWDGWRASTDLCTLVAQDKSGRVGALVLRRLFTQSWPDYEIKNLAAVIVDTTSISGKDVVDACKEPMRALEQSSDDPGTVLANLTRTRGKLLRMLGNMGRRAADAAPFLVGEMEKKQDDLQYVANIRLVLAIIGHEPEANLAETVKVLRSEDAHLDASAGLLSLMVDLRLGAVLPESAKGFIVSALTDYLSSKAAESDGAEVAMALARLGVPDTDAVDAIRRLMQKTGTPTQSHNESTYLPVCDYIFCGYAVACLDVTHEKEEIRDILEKAGKYELAFPIDACMGILGHEAPPSIIGDALEILPEADGPALLGAVALLSGAGGKAPAGAQDKVLAVLRHSKDETIRYYAVKALGAVSDPSMAPMLLDLAKDQKSEDVKRVMLDTAERLRLFQ